MKILFVVPLSLLCMSIYAVDDGQSQFLVALLIHEKGLHTHSANDAAQKVSALGLLKEFDSAHAEKNIERATIACHRLKWLIAMDWAYLTPEQQTYYLMKENQAGNMLNSLKRLSKLKALSHTLDENTCDKEAVRWLTNCVNQGLCGEGSEVWEKCGREDSRAYPSLKQLNAARIAYLECAGKLQATPEKNE